jgi:CheY-like chemotaxis protein
MRFLIVDDSSTMRRIIINTLNKLGYDDIVEAGNGREGVDRLGAGQVDVIVTDWNMPEMSGIEFIRHVRGTAATSCTTSASCCFRSCHMNSCVAAGCSRRTTSSGTSSGCAIR